MPRALKAVAGPRFAVLALLVVGTALTRLIELPPNFTPVLALGLFAGAYVQPRSLAVLLPLLAMLLSDLLLGAHALMWVVYGCIAACALLGRLLRGRIGVLSVAGMGLGASLLFFVVTNFAVWALGTMYPHTLAGLLACYVAAIPFFHTMLASTLLFSALLFGVFEGAQRRFPQLREAAA